MENPSLQIGDNNWAVKDGSILGYNILEGNYLPQPIDFTRASTATRVNAEGLIETSPVNLIEQSETFDNVFWLKGAASITANATVAPNGTTTADKFIESATLDTHQIYTSFVGNTGVATLFIYAKKAERNAIQITSDQITDPSAIFNLDTGVIYSSANCTPFIESVGSGWYKCGITYIIDQTTSYPVFRIVDSSFSVVYTGNGTSGIFIWGAQLNIGSTAKPYFPTTDRLNIPRIDYTGGGFGKLLLEPQRTNLINNSANVGAGFVTTNITLVLNNAAAPNGLVEADKFYPNTSGNYRWFYQAVTTSASNTISVFAKADGKDILYISEGSLADVSFDLSSGLVIFERSGWVGSIEDFGDGWYRCIAVKSSSVSFAAYGVADIGGSNSVTASGTDGLLVWGMQCEVGSYPTSYIPTSGTAVTRVKDTSGTSGLSSLINSSEGTLYVEIRALANDQTERYITLNDGSNTNVVRIGYFVTNPNQILYQVNASGLQANVLTTDYTITDFNKIAVTWKLNEFKFFINGVQVGATDVSGTPPIGLTTLAFGNVVGLNQTFYGENKGVMIFQTALSDDDLTLLTGTLGETYFESYALMANYLNYTIQ